MTVCRYFLQGTCTYGSYCRFEHPAQYQQQQQQYHSNDRYRYNQSQNARGDTNQQSVKTYKEPPPKPIDNENISDDAEFLSYMAGEFKLWLNSSAWKFSCYSYMKYAPCIPILSDVSLEELRFSIYEARRKCSPHEVNQLALEWKLKEQNNINTIGQIVSPDQPVREYLLSYFHESEVIAKKSKASALAAPAPTPFATSATSGGKVNPFAKIVEQSKQMQQPAQQQQPLFSFPTQSASLFTQQAQHTSPTPIGFQQPQQGPLITSFPTQQAPVFQAQQTNPFFAQQAQLAPPPNAPANPFGNQNAPPLAANPFNNNNNNNQSMSVNNNLSGPKQALIEQPSNGPYSNMRELSTADLEQFKSGQFSLKKIPRLPPPTEFC